MIDHQITQEQFERALPVGTCGQSELFDFIKPSIEESLEDIERDILGEKGVEWANADEKHGNRVMKLAVLQGFLAIFRQLDLVLTPTGFGVVSNDSTVPASKMRVDELYEQLQKSMLIEKGKLIYRLSFVNGWGKQDAARRAMPYFFHEGLFFNFFPNAKATEWYDALPIIRNVEILLQQLISPQQMGEFRMKRRCGESISVNLTLCMAYCNAIEKNDIGYKAVLRDLLNEIENGGEEFKTYLESKAYECNHHKGYENKKQDPSFFFLG